MQIRPAGPGDGELLASLLSAYLAEEFPAHTGSSAAVLERDVLGGASGLRVLLIEVHGQAAGFIAWHRVYDLHWAKRGAQIDDLYVVPARRGLGLALALVAAVCAATAREGGSYLQGVAFDRASPVGRFYERIAVAFDSAECHCAGRAFRRLAALHGQPPRAIARGLPPKSWNYEP
ncbi:MAG TPA: GNAT family N-acetyltransferase [Gemmatimonadaceae bacterium]|nr:GNAT family N-acetyltransferase [Gemmatimonadaceae bacterium]